jgi:anti-anti-sigma factor
MEIQEHRQGAVTIVTPKGPLIQADAEVFRARLEAIAERSLGRLILDLTSVAYVDSAGLECLLDTAEYTGAAGDCLKVCGVNDTLREVFDLTEVSPHFEFYSSHVDAVRSFL